MCMIGATQFLDEVDKEIKNNMSEREKYVSKYAWAVPNEDALNILKKYSPIVEIGAGSGYWAHLAQQMGTVITPFDAYPGEKNKYKHFKTWTTVHKGDESVLKDFGSDVNLFLCWPPFDDPMAINCLNNFNGNILIYIGEEKYGCTGNEEFHDVLYNDWEIIETEYICQWAGLHDSLFVYKRK